MLILGLDLSLGSTGWAHIDYEDGSLVDHGVISPNQTDELEDRIWTVARQAGHKVTEAVSNVFIEAPIVHAKHSAVSAMRLAMLHGAVWFNLHGECPVNDVNVATLKKWATGNGNAKKPDMVAEAQRRFGVWLSNDEADAALIGLWGREQILEAVANHPGSVA